MPGKKKHKVKKGKKDRHGNQQYKFQSFKSAETYDGETVEVVNREEVCTLEKLIATKNRIQKRIDAIKNIKKNKK